MNVSRVLSLGAGVQSSTLYLMAVHGEFGVERPVAAVFADTQWEPAAVYGWLSELGRIGGAVIPIHCVTIGNIRRDALDATHRFASMPLFTKSRRTGGGQLRRQCTREYKVTPVAQFIRRTLLGLVPGRPVPAVMPVELWLGISLDEASRMKPNRLTGFTNRWPLVERDMTRRSCALWLDAHGYQTPPKSACIGCPYTDNHRWREMQRERPAEFADAVAFDAAIRDAIGSEPAYLHRSLVPLSEIDFSSAEELGQLNHFENECEGMCGV